MIWLFSAVGLFLGWLALRDIRWDAFLESFGWLNPLWAVVFLLCMAVMIYLRTQRWEGMIRTLLPSDFDKLFVRLTTWVGFAAVMVFPLRAGELYRCAVFRSRPGRPGNGSAVLGALLLERALDGLAVACMLALALGAVLWRHDSTRIHVSTWVLWGLVSAGFSALLAIVLWMAHSPQNCIHFLFRWSGLVLLKKNPNVIQWMQKISDIAERLSQGVRHGLHTRILMRTILLTVAYWGMNVIGVWALQKAFYLPTELEAAGLVVGFSAIGVFIPGPPGHVGNFHEFARLGLSSQLSNAMVVGTGMAFVVTLHAVQTLMYLSLGLLAFLLLASRSHSNKT